MSVVAVAMNSCLRPGSATALLNFGSSQASFGATIAGVVASPCRGECRISDQERTVAKCPRVCRLHERGHVARRVLATGSGRCCRLIQIVPSDEQSVQLTGQSSATK